MSTFHTHIEVATCILKSREYGLYMWIGHIKRRNPELLGSERLLHLLTKFITFDFSCVNVSADDIWKRKKKYQWTRVWPCMTYKQYSKTLILRGGKMTLNVCFSTTRTQTQRAAVALSCQKLALPADGWIRGGKYTVQSGYRDRRRGPHTLDILHKSLNVEKHGVYLHKSSIWIEF